MSVRIWLWLHMFFMWLTLSLSGFTLLVGRSPPPLLLLLGVIQAVIVYRECEREIEASLEKKDVP